MNERTSSTSITNLPITSQKKSVTFSEISASSVFTIDRRDPLKPFTPKKCCLKKRPQERKADKHWKNYNNLCNDFEEVVLKQTEQTECTEDSEITDNSTNDLSQLQSINPLEESSSHTLTEYSKELWNPPSLSTLTFEETTNASSASSTTDSDNDSDFVTTSNNSLSNFTLNNNEDEEAGIDSNTKDTFEKVLGNLSKLINSTEYNNNVCVKKLSKETPKINDREPDLTNTKVPNPTAKTIQPKEAANVKTLHLTNKILPIECTNKEVIWGCVSVGQSSIKKILIRNNGNHQMNIKLATTSSCYQIMTSRYSEAVAVVHKVELQPHETREFYIVFLPQTIGALVHRLYFLQKNVHFYRQQKLQFLKLYGYGGNSKIKISNMAKDELGTYHLQLSELGRKSEISGNFILRNYGDLPAFVCFTIGMKTLNKLKIEPNDFVLNPMKGIVITITYSLTDEYIYNIMNSNLASINHVATLRLVLGTEATRARIQRLGRKLLNDEGAIGDPLIKKLCETFVNEHFPTDTNQFEEPIDALNPLMQSLSFKEIRIRINENLLREEIIYSKCFSPSSRPILKTKEQNYTVTPTNITFRLSCSNTEFIMVTSECNVDAYFNVKVIPGNLIHLWPTEGLLQAGNSLILELSCIYSSAISRNFDKFKVIINVGNDVLKVNGRIVWSSDVVGL